MSYQRKRGQYATVFPSKLVTDARGNSQREPDLDSPRTIRGAFIPQRSARAALAGQQGINVVRMLIDPDVTGVDLWALVRWNGSDWDVVTPPAYHSGSRHSAHISIDLRERPHG